MSRCVKVLTGAIRSIVPICFGMLVLTGAAAHAQDGEPPNTIDCRKFIKGGTSWNQIGMVDFDFASRKHLKMAYVPIVRGSHVIDDFDLYKVLEIKCGGR